MLGSTYSLFGTSNVDEDLNVYKTGNLDVSYTLSSSNVVLSNVEPMSEEEADGITPYRITVNNNGTVPYMFDISLVDSTATDAIDYQYVMTKVGYLGAKPLSECTDNVIREKYEGDERSLTFKLDNGSPSNIILKVKNTQELANLEIIKNNEAGKPIENIAFKIKVDTGKYLQIFNRKYGHRKIQNI